MDTAPPEIYSNCHTRSRHDALPISELLHHVGLAADIQVDLHRAGAGHHVQAQRADPGHVLAHDLVAPLGHPRHLFAPPFGLERSEEHTSELQSLMRISYAVFGLKKK